VSADQTAGARPLRLAVGRVFLMPAQLAMLLEGIDWRQQKRLLTSLTMLQAYPGCRRISLLKYGPMNDTSSGDILLLKQRFAGCERK